MNPRALDLGAGTVERLPGAIRLDRARAVKPTVVADADRPLPFRDSSFETVGAYDVVEHVSDLIALVEEVHRVLAPGGRFLVTTPHFSCANAFTDPTHRRALALRSFAYFGEGHPGAYYSRARFRQLRASVFFHPGLLGRLGSLVARFWPEWWEHHLTWALPGWFLYFELEAVKAPAGLGRTAADREPPRGKATR